MNKQVRILVNLLTVHHKNADLQFEIYIRILAACLEYICQKIIWCR